MERVQRAAEEAAWLIGRGYGVEAVAAFVGQQRALSPEERRMLSSSAALSANYKHHIARELESEDVARRPLRIDAASAIAVVQAARKGALLIESEAGVVCDPEWSRAEWSAADGLDHALGDLAAALKRARPKSVRWLVGETHPEAKLVASAISSSAAMPKQNKVAMVSDVVAALDGAAFVVSSDPAVLDRAASWYNLVAAAVDARDDKVQRVRL
jgi:hypothetical protein